MKIKLLLTLFIILNTFNIIGQNNQENQIYYSRYEGVVDSNIMITANIVRLFDDLSGNYSYQQTGDIDTLNVVNTITIVGDVSDEIAMLKEYGQDEYTFSGKLNQNSFTGTWSSPHNDDIPFSISEKYPIGAMPFDVYYLHSEDQLTHDSANSPVAEIELTLIYPLTISGNNIGDSVKHIIANGFFGANFFENNPDSMLTHFESEFYTNYKDQNSGRPSNGASYNWQKIVNMSVIHNSDYLLCVEYLIYAYSGGAHGMTKISYDNVDLSLGNLLSYEDIFKVGTQDSLANIITKQLYIDKKIPSNISLKEAGYFVDIIEANHNFYIVNNGIGFLYNSYEIAPYSFGQTNIFIEFDKLKTLIIEDSPIFEICNR
ncbi:MAG: DUF3298 domain-containing protein [Bacteroidetes bacterium]|nr:DUF3298 domain-containing protein [Bacteroidota bacterium]